MAVDRSIFKAYDIRGIYGTQIDGALAEEIGRAFIRVLSELSGKPATTLTVALGRDMRISAPELAARYCEGMVKEGATVLDAGMVGSEMVYYLVGSRNLDGGLVCTASHNPKIYTGAKLLREGALALSGESGIDRIRELLEAGLGPAVGRAGRRETLDIYNEYQEAVLSFIDPAVVRGLKVVVDGGNGMAGPMVGPLLERLGVSLLPTYWEPDGNFPDHEPNPLLAENRQAIVARVKESGADLGIAWDGDADRCFFIDGEGRFVDGDFLTALLAQALLEKHPGQTILYDVRASWAVPETVRAAGGVPQINRVGHAFFKRRMREEGALFGGEVSGHYYFRDFYCADSGAVPALLVLELLSRRERSLSELLEPFRCRYFISGEINSTVVDQQGKLGELANRYRDGHQSWLDGLSVDYEDWHFNVRPSNTEPLLRLCLESLRSPAHMESKRDEVLGVIRG